MEKTKEEKKATYDELKNYVGQLQQQNRFLAEQLNKGANEQMFKRIEYLFKVMELKDSFDLSFVLTCSNELQSILTMPEGVVQEEE